MSDTPKLLTMAYVAKRLNVRRRWLTGIFVRAGIVDNVGTPGRGARYVTTKIRIQEVFPQIASML